jgi:hypothetical protein
VSIQRREIVIGLIFLFFLAWQTLLPGFIGMANNGDFAKVAGRLCIGGADNGAENFVYFKSDYLRDSRFCLIYGPPSSELLFAGAASQLEERISGSPAFDIRWLGALHLAGWFGCYAILIRALRPLRPLPWCLASALAYGSSPTLTGSPTSIRSIPMWLRLLGRSGLWPRLFGWFCRRHVP